MVQIVLSIKNTFVHADVDSIGDVELGSKTRKRASSTPARTRLETAESEKYNEHAFGARRLEDLQVLPPHDDDDYSSMHTHPGPPALDMDVECMMDCRVSERSVGDDCWGLSALQLEEAAQPDFVNAGIDIVGTLGEDMDDYSASAPACHGFTYVAQLPDDSCQESMTLNQSFLSTAPTTPRESAQRQFRTSPMLPCEQQRDHYRQSYSGDALALPNAKHEETQDDERTTVMLMNIPLRYTSSRLIRTMDSEGFAGMYDFIYVPMASSRRTSKGYAFVNCVNPSIAQRFVSAFNGFSRWTTASQSVCQPVWATQHQGLHANIDRYRNSTVMKKSVPDEYKPRIFKNGEEVPFPPSTRGQPRKTNGQQALSL